MKQAITRKMIEMALILKEFNGNMGQSVVPQPKAKLNKAFKHVYCGHFQSNLIKDISPEMYMYDLLKGKGGELGNQVGSAPKFNSITSSTALAVNTFAPWKKKVRELIIKTKDREFSGFESLEFEHVAKTKNRSYPNLDVWLQNDSEVLAIECKFCEFFGNDYTELQRSYRDMINREGYTGPWIDAIDQVTDSRGKGTYKYFDVVQIIKHYFGLINTDIQNKHLLYMYWHPENKDWNKIDPYDELEKELADFYGKVSKAVDVHFHYLSFNDLWKQWENRYKTHVKLLREKYSVIINQE